MRSGKELVNKPVPEITYRVEGLLRANGGRLSITGPAKTKKSFLTMDLALRIAAGDVWLGYNTTEGNVLYLNLEISSEKFQERVQDLQYRLKYDKEVLVRFHEVTVLDRNIALNKGTEIVQNLLDQCRKKGFAVNTLVIDPRARAIDGSENEEVEIKRFCDNVDTLIARNIGLSGIIVTHMGKDPTKGAIGHSRYIGWLDTDIKIVNKPKIKCDKQLEITGRDAESETISLDFKYPLHIVNADEDSVRISKVDKARELIISELEEKAKSQQKLRRKAMEDSVTDYAFNRAIRQLKGEKLIKSVQSKGPGNKKYLKLVKKRKGV
ncbi:AAA family ATPase [Chloroflexota bacterium]